MPHRFTKLTPNLVVADVARSLAFYRDVLGFTAVTTVPEKPPFVFAMMRSGGVEIYLNAPESAVAEYPAFQGRPIGGTLTLFFEIHGIDRSYEALKGRAHVIMPLETKWYGTTEFALTDPDGYILAFAERKT